MRKILIAALLLLCAAHRLAAQDMTLGRYALIVGSNDGGANRVMLKYAVSDANSIVSVLKEMGGVTDDSCSVLTNPSRDVLASSMRNMLHAVKMARNRYKRVEFIFYYSGHSDEEGILLYGEKMYYREIKKAIDAMTADVRIAILDSCSSGAFARLKGGKKRAPFLLDASNDMKGYAFMSSSSASEAAQESDNIRGSFFTHYLASGLRGVADMSSDGRITLNEAYQFAYRETLARTEKTLNGPQHPYYHIQMTGTGDVVMTDVRKSGSVLVMNKNLSGRFSVRDVDGILVAEFSKPYGREIEIGIGRGGYRIVNNRDDGPYEAAVSVGESERTPVKDEDFTPSRKEAAAARGNPQGAEEDRYLASAVKKVKNGVYGAPTVSFSHMDTNFIVLAGGRICWIMNHNWVLGLNMNAKVSNIRLNDFNGMHAEENHLVDMGYGGLLFEYNFMPDRLVTMTVGMTLGAGVFGVNVRESEDDSEDIDYAKRISCSFAMEPEAILFINVTKFMRIGFGLSYRFCYGGEKDGIRGFDFSGVSGSVILAFGIF